MSTSALNETAVHPAPKSGQPARSIYGPVVDFLLLGGGSLIILPLAALIPETYAPRVLAICYWLSFVINYPHFAHSYQIFYRDFANKIRGNGYPPHLRYRYVFAGLVVPLLIIAGFAAAFISGSARAMGLAAAAMGFFVGWHYVKQGYGILIVDSVFHRSYFNDTEKKLFRANAYGSWIFFFLLAFHTAYEKEFLGLKYYVFPVPLPLLVVAGLVMVGLSCCAVWMGIKAERRNAGNIPWNGYVAYVTSLYIWLGGFFVPIVLYIIPAFHSLQYLAIVWKYEINREKQKLSTSPNEASADTLWIRFATFVLLGVVLGACAFWFVPATLDAKLSYDRALFGSSLFSFMILIFINIHHYFLDNVMWRKDNPDVGRHLFGRT